MSAEQLALLDPSDTGVDARSSRNAPPLERALTLKPSAVVVLEVVRRRGEATAHDAAVDTGQQQSCASKRLGELERLGLVAWTHRHVDGPRSRPLKVYRLTEQAGVL